MGYRVGPQRPLCPAATPTEDSQAARRGHVHALQSGDQPRPLSQRDPRLKPPGVSRRLKQDLERVFAALAAMPLKGL